jgi:membrane dipeptidase
MCWCSSRTKTTEVVLCKSMEVFYTVNRDVEQIHRETIVVDSHNDSIMAHVVRGNHTLARDVPHNRRPPVQLNVQKMRDGGIDVAYAAVAATRPWANHLAYVLDAFGFLEAQLQDLAGDLVLARSWRDIVDAKQEGRKVFVLTIENSDALEGSLNILRVMFRLGVRSVSVTHNARSLAADGNDESDTGGGLTRFGRDLVRAMNQLGMLVDVSHLSERGFWDVLKISEAPVIASHSCCKALCDHPRNLDDAQLKALGEIGGVVGITFVPWFVSQEAPSMENLLNHIDHAVQMAGIDHVGIGSDFDGGGDLVKDASQFPTITEGLLKRGYSPEEVKKILGENHMRVFREVCS